MAASSPGAKKVSPEHLIVPESKKVLKKRTNSKIHCDENIKGT